VQWVVGRLQPNSSFKPTPLHGIVLSFGVRLLSLRLHLVAARLNSGVSAVHRGVDGCVQCIKRKSVLNFTARKM